MNRDFKIIFSFSIARELLRRGHRIADIKPDKKIPDKTIFVFEVDKEFTKDLADILGF